LAGTGLLARVEAGEEVVIARAGQPIARLIPVRKARGRRRAGRLAGTGWIADDFDPFDRLLVAPPRAKRRRRI
jgi:prevent-host-death family protein